MILGSNFTNQAYALCSMSIFNCPNYPNYTMDDLNQIYLAGGDLTNIIHNDENACINTVNKAQKDCGINYPVMAGFGLNETYTSMTLVRSYLPIVSDVPLTCPLTYSDTGVQTSVPVGTSITAYSSSIDPDCAPQQVTCNLKSDGTLGLSSAASYSKCNIGVPSPTISCTKPSFAVGEYINCSIKNADVDTLCYQAGTGAAPMSSCVGYGWLFNPATKTLTTPKNWAVTPATIGNYTLYAVNASNIYLWSTFRVSYVPVAPVISCTQSTYLIGQTINCTIQNATPNTMCSQSGKSSASSLPCTSYGWAYNSDSNTLKFNQGSVTPGALGDYTLFAANGNLVSQVNISYAELVPTISCTQSTYHVGQTMSCTIQNADAYTQCSQSGTASAPKQDCPNYGWVYHPSLNTLTFSGTVTSSVIGNYTINTSNWVGASSSFGLTYAP